MNAKALSSAYTEFLKRYGEAEDFCSALALFTYDEEAYMPRAGSSARSRVMASLASLVHQRTTDDVFLNSVEELTRDSQGLDQRQQVSLKRFLRGARRQRKLPGKLVSEITHATISAHPAWHKAKTTDSFAVFAPHLERIVALKREEISAVGFAAHPYDALLDQYEQDFNCEQADAMFSVLLPRLLNLRNRHLGTGRDLDDKFATAFPLEKQVAFARRVIQDLGFDFSAGRIDAGNHPNSIRVHAGDVRLLYRIHDQSSLHGVLLLVHEAGHGIYEQNIDPALEGTPLYAPASTAFHEAHARFWENIVCKSREFWEGRLPMLKEVFGGPTTDCDVDDVLWSINRVSTSPIRLQSDEISYVFHIYVRYVIEKGLMDGSLSVSEVPDRWVSLMEQYLNVTPEGAAEGCLQDDHWSCGMFGYFPVYVLGTVYSARVLAGLSREIEALPELLRKGTFGVIVQWLRNNLCATGATYLAGELLQRVDGGKDSKPEGLAKYLEQKYDNGFRVGKTGGDAF